jgi:predicted ATPase with chaperone activity
MPTALHVPAAAPAAPESAIPTPPETLAETGLPGEVVAELLLKALYGRGTVGATQLSEIVGLSYLIVDEQLHELQQRRQAGVVGGTGRGRKTYRYELTQAGRVRAQEALAASQYVGPAPVPLEQYLAQVERQSRRGSRITRDQLREAFADLVLSPEVIGALGPAVNSARALLLYGPSGSGKTLIAETLAAALGGTIYVPHAVLMEGQIVSVYDPVYHHPAAEEVEEEDGDEPVTPAWAAPEEVRDEPADAEEAGEEEPAVAWFVPVVGYDRRYVRVKRPAVVTGGELSLEQLDLQQDPRTHLVQAPVQLKANGGVLIIDDLGRHRVPARSLLNRWLVPLEKKVDYLTLPTGEKVTVPFDCLVIFTTDMNLGAMLDSAFLRRIPFKIRMPEPTRAQWEEIFRRQCWEKRVPYRADAPDRVFHDYYEGRGIAPRSCHPRDLLECLCATASFLGVEPALSPDLLEQVCESYFVTVSGWEGAVAEVN